MFALAVGAAAALVTVLLASLLAVPCGLVASTGGSGDATGSAAGWLSMWGGKVGAIATTGVAA